MKTVIMKEPSNDVCEVVPLDNGERHGTNGESTKEARKQMAKRPFFVNTPVTTKLFTQLEDLLTYPKKNRMPCLMVVGDPNSGKSRILQKFRDKHSRHVNPSDYSEKMPVWLFEMWKGHESAFFDAAFRSLGITPAASHKVTQKEHRFCKICQDLEVKVLIIDEFHNGMHGGARQQLQFLTLVRHLSNILQLPLVVAGTAVVKTFLFSDPQLSTRFKEVTIPLWQDGAQYRGFLRAVETAHGLKRPSNLATSNDLAAKIRDMSEGLTGEMVNLLEMAAVEAIETGVEQITSDLLDSLEWTKPSLRRD